PSMPVIFKRTNLNVRVLSHFNARTLGSVPDNPSIYFPPVTSQTVKVSPSPHPKRLPLSHDSNCSLQTSFRLSLIKATCKEVGLSPNSLVNALAKFPVALK